MLFAGIVCAAGDVPERIVSLGPTITENLYLLGVENNLIADTEYCQRPQDAVNKEKIGTVTQADIEKIVSLEPDLVIATGLTKPEQTEKMKNMGLRVKVFHNPKHFKGLCENFVNLGEIVGKKDKAERILERVRSEVDGIRMQVKGLAGQKVFVQLGAKPLFAATGESFVHDFIRFAGGINVAGDSKRGTYSRERVLKDNPDVILIVTMGITGEKEKKVWEKYTTINAVKNARIHIIDSYRICSPTPETFVQALREIVKYLHGIQVNE